MIKNNLKIIFYVTQILIQFWTWYSERRLSSPTWPWWSSACCGPSEGFEPFRAKSSSAASPSRSPFEGRRRRTRPRWSRRSLGWKTSRSKWRSEWFEALPFPGISQRIIYIFLIQTQFGSWKTVAKWRPKPKENTFLNTFQPWKFFRRGFQLWCCKPWGKHGLILDPARSVGKRTQWCWWLGNPSLHSVASGLCPLLHI